MQSSQIESGGRDAFHRDGDAVGTRPYRFSRATGETTSSCSSRMARLVRPYGFAFSLNNLITPSVMSSTSPLVR
jgi:hypothetical protein